MNLYVQHVSGPRPTNRVAPGPHPGLRNHRLEWEPRDAHGVLRFEVSKMWGSCLTGGAAISLSRASSGTATDGGGVHGAVESVIQGEYGRRTGDAAVGAAGAGNGGIGKEGQAAVEARREAGAQDE